MKGRRSAAAIVALVAWSAVVLMFLHTLPSTNSSPLLTLWREAAFFTEWSNLLVAVVFSGLALGWARIQSWAVGQALSAILLVVIGYWGSGQGMAVFGRVGAGDVLAHAATPASVVLYWLACWPKGDFRLRYAMQWVGYPFLYLTYALIRGAATDSYAYPWLDVSKSGYAEIALPVALISAACVGIGLACVWLDRLLSGGRPGVDRQAEL